MKVEELIEKLQSFDKDTDVLCYTEDENLLIKGHNTKILEIDNITQTDAEKKRGEDNIAYLKFGKSDVSEKHVLIELIGDF